MSMDTTHTQALIGMLTVLGLLALMVLPAVFGIVHDRRIDRQLRRAGAGPKGPHTAAGPSRPARDAVSRRTARAA
ncbi:hypothetical protein SUDANB132_02283 [Streptomyces sp. enrichment culture]